MQNTIFTCKRRNKKKMTKLSAVILMVALAAKAACTADAKE
jgi:hypothetical protein